MPISQEIVDRLLSFGVYLTSDDKAINLDSTQQANIESEALMRAVANPNYHLTFRDALGLNSTQRANIESKAVMRAVEDKNIPLSFVQGLNLSNGKRANIENERVMCAVKNPANPLTFAQALNLDSSEWVNIENYAPPKTATELMFTGAGIDKDKEKIRALREAAYKGYTDIVQELIDDGVQLDTIDGYGNTPIAWAVENGHESIVQKLIAAGADVNKGSPLGNALGEGHTNSEFSDVYLANIVLSVLNTKIKEFLEQGVKVAEGEKGSKLLGMIHNRTSWNKIKDQEVITTDDLYWLYIPEDNTFKPGTIRQLNDLIDRVRSRLDKVVSEEQAGDTSESVSGTESYSRLKRIATSLYEAATTETQIDKKENTSKKSRNKNNQGYTPGFSSPDEISSAHEMARSPFGRSALRHHCRREIIKKQNDSSEATGHKRLGVKI